MPDFTPGKWWFILPSREVPEVIDSNSRSIVRMSYRASRAEMEANACLIATTTDMYVVIADLLNDDTFKDEPMRARLSKLIARIDDPGPYKIWSEIFEDLGRTVRLRQDD